MTSLTLSRPPSSRPSSGKLQVTSVTALEGGRGSEDDMLRMAAAAEAATRHPLAEAVLREAESRGLSVPHAQDPRTEAGSGG